MRHRPAIMRTIQASTCGFTLLELCLVLVLLALLAGVCMPAMNSALTEQALRSDTRQLSLLVKEAMMRCEEENTSYVLRLHDHHLSLSPDVSEKSTSSNDSTASAIDNAIAVPDSHQAGTWDPISTASWTFAAGALCPMPRVRVQRGDSSIEMSFDALTGDVEDETSTIQ